MAQVYSLKEYSDPNNLFSWHKSADTNKNHSNLQFCIFKLGMIMCIP